VTRRHPLASARGPGAVAALLLLLLSAPARRPEAAGPALRRLALAEVVARAEQNPAVEAAGAASDAAREKLREVNGLRGPRFELSSFLAPSPEIECLDPSCTRTSPEDVALAFSGVYGGLRLSATQPLFTFGKLSAGSQAAAQGARAAEQLARAARRDQGFEAVRAYYGLKLARELRWMLEDGAEQIDRAQKKLEEALAAGSGDATVQDRLRIETLRGEVGARLAEAGAAEQVALAGVRALTGLQDAEIDEEPLEPLEEPLGTRLDDYLARAEQRRPELLAARAGAAAAERLEELERARLWPDLALIGGLEWARAGGVDDPPSAFARDPFNTTAAALAVALRWTLEPVPQLARVAQARAQTRRAAAVARGARRLTRFEVERAYQEARHARERLTAAQRGEASARSWLASVVQADAVGVVEAKDFADAYIAFATLRARMLQGTHDWNVALWALRRASGEWTRSSDVDRRK
jgi:outer membrane protein